MGASQILKEKEEALYLVFKLNKSQNIVLFLLVPLAGLEPARMLLRRILSPLRLPIPPQRHVSFYSIFVVLLQILLRGQFLSPLRLPIPPLGRVFLLSFQFFCEKSVNFSSHLLLSPLRLPIPPHQRTFLLSF